MPYRPKRFPKRSLANRVDRISADLADWQAHYKTQALEENMYLVRPRQWQTADSRAAGLEHAVYLADQLATFIAGLR